MTSVLKASVAAALAWCWLLGAAPASAQTAAHVAVVVNERSPESQQIAAAYIKQRGIPEQQVISLRTEVADSISFGEFGRTIQGPIADALQRRGLQDQILFLVLTKGMPLRIEGTAGPQGTAASVDSELTLLYRRMVGQAVDVRGRVQNPFYRSAAAGPVPMRFNRQAYDIYLVTRLDGFTVQDALALIDRARAPASTGRFVLDQRAGVFNDPLGDVWLRETARQLMTEKDRVVFQTTRDAAPAVERVMGYAAWGSNDPALRTRRTAMRFQPGAVALTFSGPDARTFTEPPATWIPTADPKDAGNQHHGSSHALLGDLIRDGVTGAVGHVADPSLQSSARPDILLPAYAGGLTLAEAAYLSLPHLSWQSVVIGDPLCAPFPSTHLSPIAIEPAVDPDTAWPATFAARRLAALATALPDVPKTTLSTVIDAERLLVRGNVAGARQVLATLPSGDKLAPLSHLTLAVLHERAEDFERARPHYQRVIDVQPQNAVALNNLAFGLAQHVKDPKAAKPLADRALALVPGDPIITDTVAWVEHLLGNHQVAAKLILTATAKAPANADIRLHAAFILAAVESLAAAREEFQAALTLNPALASRPDVQELDKRLTKAGGPLE